jgi:hypothetical protein
MKRFTTEGRNEQERRELIPTHRNAEEEVPPLGLSFEGGGVAGARRLSRRQAIGLLGGSLAGFTLLSPATSQAAEAPPFRNFDHISLECASNEPGSKFLDGNTHNSTVGLAPHTNPPFTGTRWEVVQANPGKWPPTQWWFFCRANWPRPAGAPYYEPGDRWLDGRTQNSSVGLAPSRGAQYTGTKWEVTKWTVVDGVETVALKCLGTLPDSGRYLIGRIHNGTVGLTRYVSDSYPATLWKVRKLPK